MTPLLDVRQISKTFDSTRALVETSFTLNAGEIHAMAGGNGAGKPTLMEILTVLHEGEISGVAGLTGSGRSEVMQSIFSIS